MQGKKPEKMCVVNKGRNEISQINDTEDSNMKIRKKSKLPKIPRNKWMVLCNILLLLPINFLLQIPIAMHISYGKGVLLTSLPVLIQGIIDYYWTKRHRGLFTQEQYKRYLKRQAALWILVFVLLLVVNWFVRLEY